MSLYVIEKRCVAVVDGKAVHYRPNDHPLEIADAVAATLGDAVKRYGDAVAETPVESVEASVETTPAEDTAASEEAAQNTPERRGRRPHPGGDNG